MNFCKSFLTVLVGLCVFGAVDGAYAKIASEDYVTAAVEPMQTTGNMVDSISADAAAGKYPSVAAVNNALANKANVGTLPTAKPAGDAPQDSVFVWFE